MRTSNVSANEKSSGAESRKAWNKKAVFFNYFLPFIGICCLWTILWGQTIANPINKAILLAVMFASIIASCLAPYVSRDIPHEIKNRPLRYVMDSLMFLILINVIIQNCNF